MATKTAAFTDRYPARWRRRDGAAAGGVLVLDDEGLRVQGRRDGEEAAETVAYGSIVRVRAGRATDDRVDGRPSIVVEERGSAPLLIAPHGIGLVAELVDAIAELTSAAAARSSSIVVVAPLREGAAAQARALVADGPPFDPAELGLTEHQVFVTEREVVFSFSGSGVGALLEDGFRDPGLWRVVLAWRRLLAGRPRVASAVYSWPGP